MHRVERRPIRRDIQTLVALLGAISLRGRVEIAVPLCYFDTCFQGGDYIKLTGNFDPFDQELQVPTSNHRVLASSSRYECGLDVGSNPPIEPTTLHHTLVGTHFITCRATIII